MQFVLLFWASKTNVTFFPVHIESLAGKKTPKFAIDSNIHLQKVHVPARHVSLARGYILGHIRGMIWRVGLGAR